MLSKKLGTIVNSVNGIETNLLPLSSGMDMQKAMPLTSHVVRYNDSLVPLLSTPDSRLSPLTCTSPFLPLRTICQTVLQRAASHITDIAFKWCLSSRHTSESDIPGSHLSDESQNMGYTFHPRLHSD